MDTNGDSKISKEEISEWVLNNFRRQDMTEASEKLQQVDINSDSNVSWMEYVEKVFGYTVAEIGQFSADPDPALGTFNKMVADEKVKFDAADQNNDGVLNVDEYTAFLHPYDFEFMHSYELDRSMADYDENNDGLISFDEYLGRSEPSEEQLLVDRANFDSYDGNGDGRLDRDEIKSWVLPDRRSMADEEAEHLLSETDLNRDGALQFSEILDRHDLWVGSAATDYGQELKHDPSEL
jgi:Ca2+-binding EF-hand superfamily protein